MKQEYMTDFDSLVLDNAHELKPFAITLTKDNEAAKDLYQETLYKALAYRAQYKAGTNIKAWLATIMRNIFINDYNRAERKKAVMEVVKANQPQHALSAEINLRIKEINTAIFNLPQLLKNAFQLYFEGYKYHEIAVALNEPLGTVKSRIHFARKMLQKGLDR